MSPTKPRALGPGDAVGVVAPASSVKPDMLAAGCQEVERLGFEVRYRPDVTSPYRYLSASLERRLEEFVHVLSDPDIRAIFCARGGYGSGQLIPHLRPEMIRANPKIICGSSDITALLLFVESAGVVVFHGPMVAASMRLGDSGYSRRVFMETLVEGRRVSFPTDGTRVLRRGEAEGRLTGGCLSLVTATLGTPYEIDTRDSILVLEDIGARPYQVDRMITQLEHAGKLDSVRGFVFGEMLDCVQHADQGYALEDVIQGLLDRYDVPILYGFPTGHASKPDVIVPFGVRARLYLDRSPAFDLLEPAVSL